MSILTRLINTFRAKRLEQEFDEELGFHVDERAADYVRQGMDLTRAESKSHEAFGTVDIIKHHMREIRMGDRSSLLVGILIGVIAMMIPVWWVWITRAPEVELLNVTDREQSDRFVPYYTSPLVTMRCGDREMHSVVMTRREPPTFPEIVPPPGCKITSVRQP